MKQRELTLLRNPQLKYLPPYILKDTETFFAKYEKMAPERRNEVTSGYKMLQEFVRHLPRPAAKSTSVSDPNHVVPGYAVHAELQMLVEAGLTPVQAIQTASLNVAQAWSKEKDFGSIENGKVGGFFRRARRPARKIFQTRKTSSRFSSKAEKSTRPFTAITKIRCRGRSKTGRRVERCGSIANRPTLNSLSPSRGRGEVQEKGTPTSPRSSGGVGNDWA